MAYEKLTLKDGDVLKASDVNHIQDGLVNIELTPGPQGPQGAKGDTGAAGKNGFGTEAQYNDIIARLDALEGA